MVSCFFETAFCAKRDKAFLAFTLREQPMKTALLLGMSNRCMGAELPGPALQKASFLDSAVLVELWAMECVIPVVLLKSGLAC